MSKSKVFSLGTHADTDGVIAAMKKQKGPVKKLQVNIDEDLHRRFKVACVSAGIEMTEVVEKVIAEWLINQENTEIK